MNAPPPNSQLTSKVVDFRQASFSIRVGDESETAYLAKCIAPYLRPSDVLLLNGDLAAGKTFFVRALVESLGTQDQVSSPTYTIANLYQTNTFEVLHVDAYRLSGAQEFYDLGLESQVEDCICLIEWGDRIKSGFDQYLQISISFPEGQSGARLLEISCVGRRWAQVQIALKKMFQEK